MKKVLSVFLALVVLLSFASCNKEPASTQGGSPSNATTGVTSGEKITTSPSTTGGTSTQPSDPVLPGTTDTTSTQPTDPTPPAGGDDNPTDPTPPTGGDDNPTNPTPPAGGDDNPTNPTPPAGGDDNPTNPTPPAGGDTPAGEKVDFVQCLSTLLSNYHWNPMSHIPEAFLPDNQSNLIDVNDVAADYSSFVSVSAMPQNGIGEQWNMVMENLQQSQIFFDVLSVVDGLATVSVAGFQNYIDKNPADTAVYSFDSGIYSVSIHCTQDSIEYAIDYTQSLSIGNDLSIQIVLSMDLETQTKSVRMQLGDANALKYTITEDTYSFAIKYLGVRRAYFELTENADDTTTGHIYEYYTVESVEICSAADFYITEDYLTVVGNKADGLIGFEGTICELYSVSSGRMLAYEVKEAVEVLGVGVTYNTLWFNLDDVSGITSIKYAPVDSSEDAEKKFFVNGSSNAWKTMEYGLSGGAKIKSRRYDIEFRTQYFYSYNSENDTYEKIAMQVPMLFVQEEVYGDLTKNVKSQNGITVSIGVAEEDLTILKAEYADKTDLLSQNKDKYSVEMILEYIGEKHVFEK